MTGGATKIVPATVPFETITGMEDDPAATAEVLVTVNRLLLGNAPVIVAVSPVNGAAVNGPGAPETVVVPVEPAAHGTTNGDDGVNWITGTGGASTEQLTATATWNDTKLTPFET